MVVAESSTWGGEEYRNPGQMPSRAERDMLSCRGGAQTMRTGGAYIHDHGIGIASVVVFIVILALALWLM